MPPGEPLHPWLGGMIATWFGLRATFTSTGILFLLTALVAFLWLPRVRDLQPKAQGEV